jgi:malonyl CoA-acyl carrier protein transacylase
MVRDGAGSFLELGPGKVLQGLVKRIAANARASGFDKINEIQSV